MCHDSLIHPWNCDSLRADPLQPPAGLGPQGFFLAESPIRARTIWLIDGFNLYHSICHAEKLHGISGLRWMNPCLLAKSTGNFLAPAVTYFTATPHHLRFQEPEALSSQLAYQRALTALRPKVVLRHGHFKQQVIRRRSSDGRYSQLTEWKEKGTDVAIALEAVRLAHEGQVDEIVVVSGDSDYVPLAELFTSSFISIRLRFAFPVGRTSRQLMRLAHGSFGLSVEDYRQAQLPHRVILPSGKFVVCPEAWR